MTVDPHLQAFDTMLLLKRGGETIFNGPLGFQSQNMISYFESIPGVNMETQKPAPVLPSRPPICSHVPPSCVSPWLLETLGPPNVLNCPRYGQSSSLRSCIAGVPRIKPTSNPATWMLEISTVSAEERAGADLTQVYQDSGLCRFLIPFLVFLL